MSDSMYTHEGFKIEVDSQTPSENELTHTFCPLNKISSNNTAPSPPHSSPGMLTNDPSVIPSFDQCEKQYPSLPQTAQSLLKETGLAHDIFLVQDVSNSFLKEWWDVFWDVYMSKMILTTPIPPQDSRSYSYQEEQKPTSSPRKSESGSLPVHGIQTPFQQSSFVKHSELDSLNLEEKHIWFNQMQQQQLVSNYSSSPPGINVPVHSQFNTIDHSSKKLRPDFQNEQNKMENKPSASFLFPQGFTPSPSSLHTTIPNSQVSPHNSKNVSVIGNGHTYSYPIMNSNNVMPLSLSDSHTQQFLNLNHQIPVPNFHQSVQSRYQNNLNTTIPGLSSFQLHQQQQHMLQQQQQALLVQQQRWQQQQQQGQQFLQTGHDNSSSVPSSATHILTSSPNATTNSNTSFQGQSISKNSSFPRSANFSVQFEKPFQGANRASGYTSPSSSPLRLPAPITLSMDLARGNVKNKPSDEGLSIIDNTQLKPNPQITTPGKGSSLCDLFPRQQFTIVKKELLSSTSSEKGSPSFNISGHQNTPQSPSDAHYPVNHINIMPSIEEEALGKIEESLLGDLDSLFCSPIGHTYPPKKPVQSMLKKQ